MHAGSRKFRHYNSVGGESEMQGKEWDMERIVNIEKLDFSNPQARTEILNVMEALCKMVLSQKQIIQEFKDEINRLKGEKGKPDIKANTKKKDDDDANIKGKMESGPKKTWTKSSKKDQIKIDKEEVVTLDTTLLPPDIEFKGYREVIIQDIEIRTNNVLYKLQQYYSPSERKTYTAELDASLQNTTFGPGVKALASTLYYENRVTENKIASFLNANGMKISEGTVSNLLIHEKAEELSLERKEIYKAGLQSSTYQQTDDTGMRVAGKNAYATIVCNEHYSAFFINLKKNRETVKKILYNNYDLKAEDADLAEDAVFTVLVCDDAPQFDKVAPRRGLCWVHEERHYQKLIPLFENHKAEVEKIRGEIWGHYDELKMYKLNPDADKKVELTAKFDKLFSQITSYDELNHRLKLTLAKKNSLLLVLDYPEIPLHNNLSENGVRELVVKRKISGGVKTEAGKTAWENNLTILATCKKLGVSFFDYMKGIYSGDDKRLELADLIANK